MADLAASLDGFNEGLLAGHRGLGVRSPKAVSGVVMALVMAGMVVGGYWGYREGHVQRLTGSAASAVGGLMGRGIDAPLVESLSMRPITIREEDRADVGHPDAVVMDGSHGEARDRVLARLDQLEAEAVGVVDRSQSADELDRLRTELARPAAIKPAGDVRGGEVAKPERVERETPIVVARPVVAPRPKPASPAEVVVDPVRTKMPEPSRTAVAETPRGKAEEVVVDPVRTKMPEPSRTAVAETPRGKAEEESASIMLFRKRDAAPVIERQAGARPANPVSAAPEGVSAPARIEKPEKPEIAERATSVPETGAMIRPPVLVVEEGGVRVIGPEGERFIPIGGKLNGKHILATSPRIGLIVTEDSAIRVHNQEQK